MAHLIICDLPVKEGFIRQNKYLLDILSLIFVIFQSDVVAANAQHLAYQSTHNEKRTGIHAGHRIVDNHNLVLAGVRLGLSAAHQMIEVQESDEVSLAFAKPFRDFAMSSVQSHQEGW